MPHWRRLLTQTVRKECTLAFDKAGSSSAAKMAMIAMTTSSSIRVNAPERRLTGSVACAKTPSELEPVPSRSCPPRTSTMEFIRFYLALIEKKKSDFRRALWQVVISARSRLLLNRNANFNLPNETVEFLGAGRQLEYDHGRIWSAK